jgi:hypothetical protein
MTAPSNRATAVSEAFEIREVFEAVNATKDDLFARAAVSTLTMEGFDAALVPALADEHIEIVTPIRDVAGRRLHGYEKRESLRARPRILDVGQFAVVHLHITRTTK